MKDLIKALVGLILSATALVVAATVLVIVLNVASASFNSKGSTALPTLDKYKFEFEHSTEQDNDAKITAKPSRSPSGSLRPY